MQFARKHIQGQDEIFCRAKRIQRASNRVQRDFYAQVMLRSDGVLAVERLWVGLDGEDAVATQVCAKSYMRFSSLPIPPTLAEKHSAIIGFSASFGLMRMATDFLRTRKAALKCVCGRSHGQMPTFPWSNRPVPMSKSLRSHDQLLGSSKRSSILVHWIARRLRFKTRSSDSSSRIDHLRSSGNPA